MKDKQIRKLRNQEKLVFIKRNRQMKKLFKKARLSKRILGTLKFYFFIPKPISHTAK